MADYLERAYRILNESRDSALDAARKVRERLNKDPLFASLENECRKLAFEKARLASQNRDISALNAKYEELSAQRAKRMEELGYSAADLKPKFSCELCRDTGKANGKDCVCLKKIVYAVLSEGQDIPCGEEGFLTRPRLDVLTADARDAYKKLYALLNRYALSFPEVKKIYTLTGAVGVGKSYAAGAVSHALMRRGFSVLFLNAVRLNEIFLEYHLAPLHLKQSVFAPLTEADLLVVDDLGAEPLLNNVTVNYLYSLLSERTKPVMITTNLDAEALKARYTDRIFSRLLDKKNSKIINVAGSDLRLKER